MYACAVVGRSPMSHPGAGLRFSASDASIAAIAQMYDSAKQGRFPICSRCRCREGGLGSRSSYNQLLISGWGPAKG